MDNVPTIFTAIIFFVLGSIACHIYKRHTIKDLEDSVLAWKKSAEAMSIDLINFRCQLPHIRDLDNIESETADFLGYTKKQLDDKIDMQLREIKNTFGI